MLVISAWLKWKSLTCLYTHKQNRILAQYQDLANSAMFTHSIRMFWTCQHKVDLHNHGMNHSLHQHRTGNQEKLTSTTPICTHSSASWHTVAVWSSTYQTPCRKSCYSRQTTLGAQPKLKLHCLIRPGRKTLSAGHTNRPCVDSIS